MLLIKHFLAIIFLITNFYAVKCSVKERIFVAIVLRGPNGKDCTDLGWELGGDVAQFLKTTHAAPDSSSDPQKAGRKEKASSSLDQIISGGLEGTLIRPRGHV